MAEPSVFSPSTIISIIALAVAILSLYLQRRDKKPRLIVGLERAYIELPQKGPSGGNIMKPMPCFTIRLRNPTENTIKVERTSFIDGKKRRFIVPSNWKTVSEIPSHDHRSFIVSISDFEKWANDVKIFQPEKGRFIICDALGNEHKTLRLGDSLSLESTNKLP